MPSSLVSRLQLRSAAVMGCGNGCSWGCMAPSRTCPRSPALHTTPCKHLVLMYTACVPTNMSTSMDKHPSAQTSTPTGQSHRACQRAGLPSMQESLLLHGTALSYYFCVHEPLCPQRLTASLHTLNQYFTCTRPLADCMVARLESVPEKLFASVTTHEVCTHVWCNNSAITL